MSSASTFTPIADAATTAQTTVVVISARNPHIFANLRAVLRDQRCRIVSVADATPWDVLLDVDVPIEMDLSNWDAVAARIAALSRRTPVDAVITHVETQVPLMAFLNERLGLRKTLPLEAAHNCRDKARTRACLAAADVPSPRFALVPDHRAAIEAAQELGFPVVVKPRDGTAGYAVRLCTTPEEVAAGVAAVRGRAQAENRMPGILVEEYLDGPEFAVQTVSHHGRVQIVNVFQEIIGPPPLFVEVGYDYPPRLEHPAREAIERVVHLALAALGVDNWVTHTQIRLTTQGPKIVEVNARVPGGRLLTMTTVTSGIDLLSAVVELALGRVPTMTATTAAAALYRSVVCDHGGTLAYEPDPHLVGLEGAVPPIIELDVQPGDMVLPVDHADGGVYGRIVVFGDDMDAAARDYQRIQEALALHVVPSPTPELLGPDARDVKRCC